jgi:hypothetical protein
MGTPVSGTFSNINWGKNAKFLQVEMDPAGGNSFTDLGTQQMMSVPYALFSEETRTVGFYARPTEISQPSTNAMIYRLAQQYCSSLVENGKSDWRMPTLEEFEYLRDLKNLTQTGDFWTKQLTFGYPQEQLFSINTSYSLSRINPIESYPYNAAQLQVFCIR